MAETFELVLGVNGEQENSNFELTVDGTPIGDPKRKPSFKQQFRFLDL